jgi:hypothetical protein
MSLANQRQLDAAKLEEELHKLWPLIKELDAKVNAKK